MSKQRHQGFTLIEVIIFIVVVSAGLAGILSVMNTVVKSSADPMVRKQALAIADSIMEEILQKEYCDPDTVDKSTNPPTCGAQNIELARADKDDVSDYHGLDNTLFKSTAPVGGWPAALDAYNVNIAVVTDTTVVGTGALPAKKVTVTVSRGSESITLTGYRGNY